MKSKWQRIGFQVYLCFKLPFAPAPPLELAGPVAPEPPRIFNKSVHKLLVMFNWNHQLIY